MRFSPEQPNWGKLTKSARLIKNAAEGLSNGVTFLKRGVTTIASKVTDVAKAAKKVVAKTADKVTDVARKAVAKVADKVTDVTKKVWNSKFVQSIHNNNGGFADLSAFNKSGRTSSEIILPKEATHDAARNTLLKEIDKTGAFKNGSNKYIGRLESSYGYGKQIGRQSFDGKVRWRLDYDEKIGVHYNLEDFSNGKGADAIKKVIPIDISYDEYTQILDLWN